MEFSVAYVGAASYGLAGLLFLLLTALLLTAWRGRLQGGLLVAASLLSVAWCTAHALHYVGLLQPTWSLELAEAARSGAWCLFLAGLIGWGPGAGTRRRGGRVHLAVLGSLALCAMLALQPFLEPLVHLGLAPTAVKKLGLTALVGVGIVGLAWVEQVFRNTPREQRWAIKPLCLGIGALFAYDFFMYANGLLFGDLNPMLGVARGAVNAMIVPFIAVGAARNPAWSLEIFVSRQVVFHSAAVFGAGVYLLGMSAAGSYIRLYGGTWGVFLQTIFLSGAVVLLFFLLFSGQLRARAKVLLRKHFFKNKYDYREEWLRFTQTLASSRDDAELRRNIVRAIAQIVESPGGVLWIRQPSGYYTPSTAWNYPGARLEPIAAADPLPRFLDAQEWIISLPELAEAPERYDDLEPAGVLAHVPRAWLVVPLKDRDALLGFLLLAQSPSLRTVNWEDCDLLKTVGRQAASYLALFEATDALASARQFEAFNRLSAYVVHDLKNLVAQLALVSANAKRFLDNPEFVADAMATVENATARMNRMLGQLRKGRLEDTTGRLTAFGPVLEKVVRLRAMDRPVPKIARIDPGAIMTVDAERLTSIIEHLVQNAQEATPDDGSVALRAWHERESLIVEIEDTGCGMDDRFIAERLFRPFDTTKGNAGMGMGVYESREFARAHGGELEVESEPGQGTCFRLRFPADSGNAEVPLLSDDGESTERSPATLHKVAS